MKLEENLINTILKLSSFFQERDIPFIIIGALVPTVLIDFKQKNPSSYGSRTTRDVDCAVRINNWSEYNRLKQDMLANGFEERNGIPEHRLFFRETPVDIIPCGGFIQNDMLYWPKSNHRMKMSGFSEFFNKVEFVNIRKNKSIPFATLPLTVFLKIHAFFDRKEIGDLEDIFYILMHYEEVKISERRFDIVGQKELEYETAGAFLLGQDLQKSIPSKLIKNLEPFWEMFNEPENPPVQEIAKITSQKPKEIISLVSALKKGLGESG